MFLEGSFKFFLNPSFSLLSYPLLKKTNPTVTVMGLSGLSKAHSVVVTVKHGVVLPNEHITQNPQWPSRGRDIQSHEPTQTDFFTSLAHLYTQKMFVAPKEEKFVTPL